MKSIFIFSLPRSGSTLIFNLISEIFPNSKIIKSHNIGLRFKLSFSKKIIVYRNIYESFNSFLIFKNKYRRLSISEFDILYSEFINQGIDDLNKIKNLSNIMLLNYKNFYNNYEYVYNKCEDYFDIKINKEKRSFLNQKYNLIDIYHRYKSKSYKYIDDNNFHGSHVSSDLGKGIKNNPHLDANQKRKLDDKFQEILAKFEP